jgi:methionyl aminopeptidase
MYKIFGTYINNHIDLRGINAFPMENSFNPITPFPLFDDVIGSLEWAGLVHMRVRQFIQPYLRPGVSLWAIAQLIEMKTQELTHQTNYNPTNGGPINKGIGFPPSLSLDNCAAHFHPDSISQPIFSDQSVLKVDFGVEVNGWIIDSAFSCCFNPRYDPLLQAVKESTYLGIKNAAVDVNIGDWGAQIQEVMESYEIELDGKIHQIKSISNLGGHNIVQGIIHGGVFLPSVDMKTTLGPDYRFKEGVYAIETFGSTGESIVVERGTPTLFRLKPPDSLPSNSLPSNYLPLVEQKLAELKIESGKKIYKQIVKSFQTLPFTNRYLESGGFSKSQISSLLKLLTDKKYIHSYPPLYAGPNDYTAQYEHTIYLGPNKKIIFSQHVDY